MENKKQILMLVSRFPYPLDKGDKLRAFHQLKELSKIFDVTLFALSDHDVSHEDKTIINSYCNSLVIHRQTAIQKGWNTFRSFFNKLPFQVGYFYNRKAHGVVRSLISNNSFDHIYCQLIRMSEYVKNEHAIPKTIDFQDTLSAGIQRRVKNQPFHKRWLFISEAKRLRAYEGRMMDFFEYKTIISEQDRQLIIHPENSTIHCIPNGIDTSFFEQQIVKKTHDFVFVGNMSYPPNIEAVHFICTHILPQFPKANLLISGSSPTAKIKRLAENSNQIEITGWIDDIRTSYARGKIFVAPMMIGTGMQNKLLEAMALGIPCITTPLANAPIKTTNNKEILVASSIDDFIEGINRLLSDTHLYSSIAINAKVFVQEKYGWAKSTSELLKLLDNSL